MSQNTGSSARRQARSGTIPQLRDQLLDVIAIRQPIIPQDVTVVPQLSYDFWRDTHSKTLQQFMEN
jgi:septum formation topological specificity factor MinE